MRCLSCNIEISKEFKIAIAQNKCPACGKQIIPAGNLSAFVPLCELITKSFTVSANQIVEGQEKQDDVESLATLVISTFNVRLKSDKEEPTKQEVETNSDAEHKQKQLVDGKATLKKLREEAYNDAIKADWGLTPAGEEPLNPDIGEALINGIMSNTAPDAGKALVDQKRIAAYSKMISGEGKVKRGG